jgi:hypothetical protein
MQSERCRSEEREIHFLVSLCFLSSIHPCICPCRYKSFIRGRFLVKLGKTVLQMSTTHINLVDQAMPGIIHILSFITFFSATPLLSILHYCCVVSTGLLLPILHDCCVAGMCFSGVGTLSEYQDKPQLTIFNNGIVTLGPPCSLKVDSLLVGKKRLCASLPLITILSLFFLDLFFSASTLSNSTYMSCVLHLHFMSFRPQANLDELQPQSSIEDVFARIQMGEENFYQPNTVARVGGTLCHILSCHSFLFTSSFTQCRYPLQSTVRLPILSFPRT